MFSVKILKVNFKFFKRKNRSSDLRPHSYELCGTGDILELEILGAVHSKNRGYGDQSSYEH